MKGIRNNRRWSRRAVLLVVVAIVALGGVRIAERVTDPPATLAEAEGELESPLLFYSIWDGTPYIVAEVGDLVIFDRLYFNLDMGVMPEWLWTGWWSYLDVTDDPASVAVSDFPIRNVLFGQVNDPAIVTVEVQVSDKWTAYPVESPGFAVQASRITRIGAPVRWLDVNGTVVWTGVVDDG